jgi:hypothetical protein
MTGDALTPLAGLARRLSFDSAIARATSPSLIWRKRHVSHTKGTAESNSNSPEPTATIHSRVVSVAIIDIAKRWGRRPVPAGRPITTPPGAPWLLVATQPRSLGTT